MAKSGRADMPNGPEQPLLSLLRESGDVLEAASPAFDATSAAVRLREIARARGLLRSGGTVEDDLRVTDAELEEEAPPFDVEAGADRLREAAEARGLLHSGTPEDSAEHAVAPETGVWNRVILIERCSSIQVGQENDQYSAYRVTLPTAALQSGQDLADQLLSAGTPWSRDVFSHDARPDPGDVSSGFGVATSGIAAGPSGDTLIIVQNSRGVQVSDHDVQRNQFRIRVADVTVQADRLGATSARNAAISRLRDDPGDRAAARSLAEDAARAASRDLVVDLTAQVIRDVDHPQINRSSDEFRDRIRNRTGYQAGGPNRARVTVHVTVSKLDSRLLRRQILKSAERAMHAARHDQPNVPPTGDLNRIRRSDPERSPGPSGGRGVR